MLIQHPRYMYSIHTCNGMLIYLEKMSTLFTAKFQKSLKTHLKKYWGSGAVRGGGGGDGMGLQLLLGRRHCWGMKSPNAYQFQWFHPLFVFFQIPIILVREKKTWKKKSWGRTNKNFEKPNWQKFYIVNTNFLSAAFFDICIFWGKLIGNVHGDPFFSGMNPL